MSKTAIANIGENDFDHWRQMFLDFANLHDVTPTPEGWQGLGAGFAIQRTQKQD